VDTVPERVRPERVAEEFREVLAEEVPRLKDPRIGFVTITRVDVSPDLRRATVFYTVLGENRDHRSTRAGLQSARTHLRTTLGHQVRLKFTPELEFQEDVGLAQVERVTELLKQIGSPAAKREAEGRDEESGRAVDGP
jgi:ribosome-binding factor A